MTKGSKKKKAGSKKPRGKQTRKVGGSVSVMSVPTTGDRVEHQYALPQTGGTVGDALTALSISAERKDILVNGRVANVGTTLAAGDSVTVTGRPSGS